MIDALVGQEFLLEGGGSSLRIRLGARIGRGADGVVFEVSSEPGLAVKIYATQAGEIDSVSARRLEARIAAMIRFPPRMDEPFRDGSGRQFPQIAWPDGRILSLRREPIGFVMPRVPGDLGCELEEILTPRGRKLAKFPESYAVRVRAARNLAALLSELHEAEHFVVDLKPKNVMAYKAPSALGLVALLDTDGFSIYGGAGRRFAAEKASEEYMAPEMAGGALKFSDAGELQDRWALAVIIFRLLNEGYHPYSGKLTSGENCTLHERVVRGLYAYGRTRNTQIDPNPLSLHEYFDPQTREFFDRAFGQTQRLRPSAREWREHLSPFDASAQGRLKQCGADSNHWHFGAGCGLCAREELIRQKTQSQRRGRSIQVTLSGQPISSAKAAAGLGVGPQAQSGQLHGQFGSAWPPPNGGSVWTSLLTHQRWILKLAFWAVPVVLLAAAVQSCNESARKEESRLARLASSVYVTAAGEAVSAANMRPWLEDEHRRLATGPTPITIGIFTDDANDDSITIFLDSSSSSTGMPCYIHTGKSKETRSHACTWNSDFPTGTYGLRAYVKKGIFQEDIVTKRSFTIAKRSPEATAKEFSDLPDGFTTTVNAPSQKFFSAKSRKPFSKGMPPLEIWLVEIGIWRRELVLTFEVANRGNIDDSLLFVRDNRDRSYGEKLYITDENDKKYYAINGFEDGRIENWNSSTGAYVIRKESVSRPRVRFPIPDRGVRIIDFHSPGISGQQGEWLSRGISVVPDRNGKSSQTTADDKTPTKQQQLPEDVSPSLQALIDASQNDKTPTKQQQLPEDVSPSLQSLIDASQNDKTPTKQQRAEEVSPSLQSLIDASQGVPKDRRTIEREDLSSKSLVQCILPTGEEIKLSRKDCRNSAGVLSGR